MRAGREQGADLRPRRLWIVLTLFLLCYVCSKSIYLQGQTRGEKSSQVKSDIIFVQTATLASVEFIDRFARGSRLVKLRFGGVVTDLTAEFFAAADPEVSFDGTKILFSGQKVMGTSWQVWEMDIDGFHKRQVTGCSEDCVRPDYLPGNEIVYTVHNSNTLSSSYVAVCKSDGSDAHPITFGPGDFQVEAVLDDGRVLVSASSPLDSQPTTGNTRQLYALRPDGTALEAFRFGPNAKGMVRNAKQTESGAVVFIRGTEPNATVGQIAVIERGSPTETLLGAAGESCLSPRGVTKDKLIVACRHGTSPSDRFDMYVYDLRAKSLGELIFADPQSSSIQPVIAERHAAPRMLWSNLVEEKTGYFISLDARISADAPQGEFSTPISRVRVLTKVGNSRDERVLGEASVERDGSFYVAVPADTPTRFQLLDANGGIIHEQRGWIWTRPGEHRSCIGCHEDKALTPENHWPLALKKLDNPVRLGVANGTSVAQ